MTKWLGKIIDRICAVVGAVIFAQFPSFVMQYQHQLTGHVSELRYQVNQMKVYTAHTGKSLDQIIQKFRAFKDADIAYQGEFIQEMVKRLDSMSLSLDSLKQASVWSKPFVFTYHLDSAIFHDTLSGYTWTIPFTFEGIIYALIGIIIGFMVYNGVVKLFRHLYHSLKNGQRKYLSNQNKRNTP